MTEVKVVKDLLCDGVKPSVKIMKTLETCDDTLEIQHNALMGSAIHIMAEIC